MGLGRVFLELPVLVRPGRGFLPECEVQSKRWIIQCSFRRAHTQQLLHTHAEQATADTHVYVLKDIKVRVTGTAEAFSDQYWAVQFVPLTAICLPLMYYSLVYNGFSGVKRKRHKEWHWWRHTEKGIGHNFSWPAACVLDSLHLENCYETRYLSLHRSQPISVVSTKS